MTAPRDYREFLNDIAAACDCIIRFVDGMTLDAYLADEKTRYARNTASVIGSPQL